MALTVMRVRSPTAISGCPHRIMTVSKRVRLEASTQWR
jgi:hypothetical protein